MFIFYFIKLANESIFGKKILKKNLKPGGVPGGGGVGIGKGWAFIGFFFFFLVFISHVLLAMWENYFEQMICSSFKKRVNIQLKCAIISQSLVDINASRSGERKVEKTYIETSFRVGLNRICKIKD